MGLFDKVIGALGTAASAAADPLQARVGLLGGLLDRR